MLTAPDHAGSRHHLALAPLVPPLLWAAFVAIMAIGGRFESPAQALRALWPAAFAWVAFALLSAVERRRRRLAPLPWLVAFGLLAVALDLLAKAWVEASLPYRIAVPVLDGWLYLFRTHNPHGTWLGPRGFTPVVAVFDLAVVTASIPVYRYWVSCHGRSTWLDLAFLGVFGGALGAVADLLLRGYVVDYLMLPGLPIADLKDQLLNLSLAAMAIEAITYHNGGRGSPPIRNRDEQC